MTHEALGWVLLWLVIGAFAAGINIASYQEGDGEPSIGEIWAFILLGPLSLIVALGAGFGNAIFSKDKDK